LVLFIVCLHQPSEKDVVAAAPVPAIAFDAADEALAVAVNLDERSLAAKGGVITH
jgi:hypothetical protein